MLLRVEGLIKNFGGIRALDGVSLQVNEGEIVALIGPNGSGKTTLLNVLSGYIKPDEGRILLNYNNNIIDITTMKPYERRKLGISRTFQGGRVFKELTVYENIYFSLLYRYEEGKARVLARDIINKHGLENIMNRKPSDLDYYSVRLLEIIMNLSEVPKLLLIDEIFSGLSKDEIENIRNFILDTHNTYRFSILWVEHVIKPLLTVSHRMVVLNNGTKLCEGTPKDVIKRDDVVKAYLGES